VLLLPLPNGGETSSSLICFGKLATDPLDPVIGSQLGLAIHRGLGEEFALHHFADLHHARSIEIVALVRNELGSCGC